MIMIRCGTCTSIFAVGDPRGVQCCSTYGDSFLQVYIEQLINVCSFVVQFICMPAAKESEVAHDLCIGRHLQVQCEGFLLRALRECVV